MMNDDQMFERISTNQTSALIGCGWLGVPLARALMARGSSVITTRSSIRNATALKEQRIPAVVLSLQPTLQCPELERLCQADVAVVMLPPRARRGGTSDYPEKIAHLLDGLKAHGQNRIIFASSTSVYPSLNRDMDETDVSEPDVPSGHLLRRAEALVMDDLGINGIIARFAGLCGPGREPGRLLAGRKGLTGGDSPVNLIHQQDAVELLITLIDRQPFGEIYNACAPVHPGKAELYVDAARRLGLTPPEFAIMEGSFKRVKADKICRELGFVYRNPDPNDWQW